MKQNGEGIWLGRDRGEHYDSEGRKIGYSKNETDWLGRPVQHHYDASGKKLGESRKEEDWLGRSRKEHEGRFFKDEAKDTNKSLNGTSSSYSQSSYSQSSSSISDCEDKKEESFSSVLLKGLGLVALGAIVISLLAGED